MPLFWISLAFLCGIWLSPSLALSIPVWAGIALLVAILLIPSISRRIVSSLPAAFTYINQSLKINSPAIYPLLIVFFCLGAIRYQLAQPRINPSFIAYYNNLPGQYLIDGVITEPPDVGDTYTNVRLRVEQVAVLPAEAVAAEFTPVHGLLLARLPASVSITYGDRIRLQGALETPPQNEDFSYRDYLAKHGIYSYMFYPSASLLEQGQGNPILTALYTFRQHAEDIVYSFYPDPEASLLSGILLGVQSGIPESVLEAFRLTGTSHIIVISGFNTTIIAGLFTFLFSRFLGARKGAGVAAIGIIFYTLLVGANAAVVRAAILGMLTLLGHQLGRRQVGLNSLSFVAAGMALITPAVLWDVSFQLSFSATLGIMLYAEPFTQSFTNIVARFVPPDKANRVAGPIGEYFMLTLAAQLTTLPLMVYYFKRISLTALITNPLILPAQPAVEVLGGLSVLLGMLFKPMGKLLAWASWPFTAYTIRMVEWLASIPNGSIPLSQIAFPLILIFYAVLFGITYAHSRLPSLIARLTPAIPLTLLAICTVLVWKAAFYAPDGRLHVSILDVGTGDAILIQTPTGRSVLINGGPSTVRLSDALGRRLPPFNRSLDWLIIAGIDNEDLSSLTANLERFTPSNVLWAGNTNGSRSASDLWTTLVSASTHTTLMQPGQALDLGSGAYLKVLSTDARGAALSLEWNNFRLLLPMGMDINALEELSHNRAMRNVSALLLAESGYAPLNPPNFISFLHPQLALLSVSPADKTGLPSTETMNALKGYQLLRTDQNGWIEPSTDGRQMWVEVEKR